MARFLRSGPTGTERAASPSSSGTCQAHRQNSANEPDDQIEPVIAGDGSAVTSPLDFSGSLLGFPEHRAESTAARWAEPPPAARDGRPRRGALRQDRARFLWRPRLPVSVRGRGLALRRRDDAASPSARRPTEAAAAHRLRRRFGWGGRLAAGPGRRWRGRAAPNRRSGRIGHGNRQSDRRNSVAPVRTKAGFEVVPRGLLRATARDGGRIWTRPRFRREPLWPRSLGHAVGA